MFAEENNHSVDNMTQNIAQDIAQDIILQQAEKHTHDSVVMKIMDADAPAKDAPDADIFAYVMEFPQMIGCHHPLAVKIAEMIALPLYDMGYALVRVRLDKNPNLQIMFDRLDGQPVLINDCQDVNYAISAILDVEDPIQNRYHLEISSTGIDRPLTRSAHFSKHIGDDISLELYDVDEVSGKRRFKGTLSSFSAGQLAIQADAQQYNLPVNNIKTAKLLLTDKLLKQSDKE